MIDPLKKAVESTPTAQLRRVTIPSHRRKTQAIQTLIGALIAVGGIAIVKWAQLSWHFSAFAVLIGLRVASKELLLDLIKIAKDLVSFGRKE